MEQVFIPKSYLGIAIEDPTVEIAIEATNPTGFLLHTCMTELFDVLRGKSNRLPQALLERFASLLKVNLGVSPQREDVRVQLRQSLFEQICIFIERNLGQPELSSRAILQAFGVSRASLYRMFEDHGGVRNYIMQRRVARAVLEIEQKATSPDRFRFASERWGFSSQPNFNRKIRSQFGTNPGKLFAIDRETFGLSDGVGRMMTDFASRTAIAA